MTDYINVFPDGMMEEAGVDPCWNNPAHPPVGCDIGKDAGDPNSGLQNLRFTTNIVTTVAHAYGLFPSQTPGPIGGDFPVNLTLYFRTKDPGTSIQFRLNLKGGGNIDITVNNANWDLLDFGNLNILREGPNGEGILWVTGIYPGVGVGDFVEVDDIKALQVLDLASTTGKPEGFNCWTCDKFQPTDPTLYQTGECRGLSPLQYPIAPVAPKGDPLFASIQHAPYTWCAAWKRRPKSQKLPDPPPIIP